MPYQLLDQIKGPEDVRALTPEQTEALCGEIRAFLLEHVSRTGGHLASNLGIVEISVAIARQFDTATDRVIYDVGHQSYVHKLLTGRREEFDSLRAFGGLSGFMRPEESGHDPFITGHASNAVSAALGLARAARLSGREQYTLAVVGDGALTGGLAYEGINDAGAGRERIIVLLNDNGMSIDKNVGALSRYFGRLRIRGHYLRAKRRYHRVMDRLPGGKGMNRVFTKIKNKMKAMLVQGSFIEQLGYTYIGPINGNDVKEISRALAAAKTMEGPVFIHAMTRKGLGYAPSEARPEEYHGVSSFRPEQGCVESGRDTFSTVFGRRLCELADEDPRICAVTAAMPSGCGLVPFREAHPERFFDVGIAEEHAVTMAAGMAAGGMCPVVAVYSTFLSRAMDEMIHDVALMKAHVVFAVDRAGLVGRDGETHQGTFDPGLLSLVPGMKIYLPASFAELSRMLARAVASEGPVAIRYPRGGEGAYVGDSGEEPLCHLRQGSHAVLVSHGRMWNTAIAAAKLLAQKDISCSLWKINSLPAGDLSALRADALRAGRVYFIEETAENATAYRLLAPELRGSFNLRLFCAGNGVVPQGEPEELCRLLGLTAEQIAGEVERDLR